VGLIAEEIKQGRPFHSLGQEAALCLLRTADRIRRGGGRLFEGRGVTGQQYNVLRILRGAGTRGLPTLDIAERMIEQTPGITRLMDRLEAKVLVRRERCPNDRRQILCWITADGLRLLAALDKPVAALDQVLLQALGRERTARLIDLLDLVRAAYQDPEAAFAKAPRPKTRPAGSSGLSRNRTHRLHSRRRKNHEP
jgi:MarR family transcriptional regulator, organic hydroperoxide resistance regulator